MLKSAVIAFFFAISQTDAGSAQTFFARPDDLVPVFRVEIWADTMTDFTNRVDAYSELRRRLESGLPGVTVTADVGQIRRGRRTLAGAIRAARSGAAQGEFFTAATSAQFQLALARIMDVKMWAVIMDENPGAFGHDVDGTYPDGKTFSTMPGLLLAELPGLPEDIQFRFVGRSLILYDLRANTIMDWMPDAIYAPPATERGRGRHPRASVHK
jgi:hypothetical protein